MAFSKKVMSAMNAKDSKMRRRVLALCDAAPALLDACENIKNLVHDLANGKTIDANAANFAFLFLEASIRRARAV